MEQLLSNPILPFVLLFAVMYFFMIRPQMKRQKAERTFQDSIKKGSKIVTTSGMHGKIVEINETDGTLVIETLSGKIKFEKSAVSMELSKKYQNATEV
ncbi:MAG: preprotein translocase subunit YajC [Flavobacteriaceae bacterium]|nr:preprotein translocase subunit YajC [Flavobacteriaceae bacterium]